MWYQNIRNDCLVLSQNTRMTDRQTDGRTDRITTSKTAPA